MSLLGLLPESAAPAVEGQVVVAGVDVLAADEGGLRELRRRSLGAVFPDPMTSLDPTMKVGAQMLEVTNSSAEAEHLLRSVGVPDPGRRLHAYPHERSGGLRQQ